MLEWGAHGKRPGDPSKAGDPLFGRHGKSCASASSQAACGHLPRYTKPLGVWRCVTPGWLDTTLWPTTSSNPSSLAAKARQRKQKGESLDGSYLLKSSRDDLSAEDIWRNYILLTRVEAAFRSLKSPLCERPIFHHLERRVETHIFLCVLAYHLLVCIERAFLDQDIHTSWETLRRQLSTHQVVTVRLPTADGRVLTIRRDTRPQKIHTEIYRVLRVPERILSPINRWTQNSH
jgi:hypothetical protein